MTIQLPKDLEESIEAAVHRGHFTSVDDAVAQAARLLLEQVADSELQTKPSTDAVAGRKPDWEQIQERTVSISPEQWEEAAADLAEEHEQHLCSVPKSHQELQNQQLMLAFQNQQPLDATGPLITTLPELPGSSTRQD
jgi:Arc/MetJ-type ribon-helix-helix transcriptional regulator